MGCRRVNPLKSWLFEISNLPNTAPLSGIFDVHPVLAALVGANGPTGGTLRVFW